jgi:arylsulfatase A-like enzyme
VTGRWKRNAFGIATVLAAQLAACGPSAEAPTRPEAAPSSAARSPNVVLIVVDTLRADHLSTYGYPRPTTPNLDRLAAESLVFERAFTVMSHTLPAHVSLVTGVHPGTHGVLSNGWTYSGPYPTLAERLRAHGYATAGFVSGIPLSRATGFDRGFDVYGSRPLPGSSTPEVKIDGEVTTARARGWLRRQGERPFFLFVHYFDTHPPYTPDPEGSPLVPDEALRAHMREIGTSDLAVLDVRRAPIRFQGRELTLTEALNVYDNEIYRVDRLVEQLRAELARSGLLDDTLLILSSDHGEGLGQHRYFSHGLHLYEEQLRIPLIVRPPQRLAWKPARIDATVSLLDVVPTVLEVTGIPADGRLQGQSLARVLAPDELEPRTIVAQRRFFPKSTVDQRGARFASSATLHALRGDSPLKYLRSGEGIEELYDLDADPRELHNLAAERPEATALIRDQLERMIAIRSSGRAVVEQAIDDETREALRALGYVQ